MGTSNIGKIFVVNKKTHTSTKDDFYIGRGKNSPLGNPYTSINHKKTLAKHVCSCRSESIAKFETHLRDAISQREVNICGALNEIFKRLRDGRNVYLVCWCKPKDCHGDVIKKIIEEKLCLKHRSKHL